MIKDEKKKKEKKIKKSLDEPSKLKLISQIYNPLNSIPSFNQEAQQLTN
jgi:pantothenate kinase